MADEGIILVKKTKMMNQKKQAQKFLCLDCEKNTDEADV